MQAIPAASTPEPTHGPVPLRQSLPPTVDMGEPHWSGDLSHHEPIPARRKTGQVRFPIPIR
jgi:hypothetical protein